MNNEFRRFTEKVVFMDQIIQESKDLSSGNLPVLKTLELIKDQYHSYRLHLHLANQGRDQESLVKAGDSLTKLLESLGKIENMAQEFIQAQIDPEMIAQLRKQLPEVSKEFEKQILLSIQDADRTDKTSDFINEKLNPFALVLDDWEATQISVLSQRLISMRTENLSFKEKFQAASSQWSKKVLGLKELIQVVSLIALLAGIIISLLLSRSIVKPIDHLSQVATEIAKGNYEQRLEIKTEDSIGALARSFNEMVEAIRFKQSELADLNEGLEEQVKDRTNSIRNLLNNAGQGFFSFNRDFELQPDFSTACSQIFKQKLKGGESVANLLFPGDREAALEFRNWMGQAFGSGLDFDVICELAPDQVQFDQRSYQLDFRLIVQEEQQMVMGILTDITQKIELEARVRKEQAFAKMILRILECKNQFLDFYQELQALLKDWPDQEEVSESAVGEIFRKVHTLKGHAHMFELQDIGDFLHKIEDEIQTQGKSAQSLKDLRPLLLQLSDLTEKTRSHLEHSLGDAIDWDQQTVKVPMKLSRKIMKSLRDEEPRLFKSLVPYVFQPFRSLFAPFPVYVSSLATRLGKSVKPLSIEGGEFLVDTSLYEGLVGSFVHILRNCLDHGLEENDERMETDKAEMGSIRIKIRQIENTIRIDLLDDGKGINADMIRKKLAEKGLFDSTQIDSMNDAQVIRCIFLPGFSSADEVSDTSGRGVGMDAVKAQVSRMKGKIRVATVSGKGSCFTIEIPLLGELQFNGHS